MRKKVIITSLILFIIAVIIMISLYISEAHFRDWIDVNILRKDLTERDLTTISLNTDKQNQVHVYSKYIALLNNKIITLYNAYGEEVTTIDVDINTGIFDSKGKYLVVAEDGGNKICLILDKTYLWSGTVEGEIIQVHVNANGYVGVITTDSGHKSILNIYNPSGKKLFKRYFSSTRIIDASFSKDNKYIAIGELDTSGSEVQSNIKIISIENAQTNPEDTIIYEHNADSGKLIVNVEYQDKEKIACMYDGSIEIIENEKNNEIFTITEKETTYMTINFNSHYAYAKEESSGLFKSSTNLKIVDTSSNTEKDITIEDLAKQIYAKDNILGINFGTVLYFYDTNAWLVKKYTSSKEITRLEFSSNLAAVIYKDKIIVIDF